MNGLPIIGTASADLLGEAISGLAAAQELGERIAEILSDTEQEAENNGE